MPQAISQRYAHALADAVLAPGSESDPKQVSSQLRSMEQMIRENADLRNVMLSPAVPNARKRGVIARLAEQMQLDPKVRNFIYVLIDRRRADLLDEIADAFDEALDERMGLVRAQVTSAAVLAEAQRAQIEQALSEASGKRVRSEFHVDPKLIGGVVARIGSTVYDGSVRTQLETMRQALVSR